MTQYRIRTVAGLASLITMWLVVSMMIDIDRAISGLHQIDPNNRIGSAINIMHDVYRSGGFSSTPHSFWRPATLSEIRYHGGDCADKSLLLASVLSQRGINTSLAMLFQDGRPTHTIVRARFGDREIILDPIWDIMLPWSLSEMRDRPERLDLVLSIEQSMRPQTDKIWRYNRSSDLYDNASAFNTNSRIGHAVACAMMLVGIRPETVWRPLWIDDAYVMASMMMALISLFCVMLIRRRY